MRVALDSLVDDIHRSNTDSLAVLARVLAHVGLLRFFDPHGLGGLPAEERAKAFARTYHRAPWDAIYSLVSSSAASAAQLRAAPSLPSDLPLLVIVHERAEGVHAQQGVEPRWQAAQARFAARSTHGRFVVATGSGHHPEEDRPELVQLEIEKFLANMNVQH